MDNNDIRQLSRHLAKLGLEQVVAERTATGGGFRIVYVNPNASASQKEGKPRQHKHKVNKSA
ncbi:hypothetical protein [Chitinophaga rhizosphaerae]|uniref:hypothetical protein n=1 Tax=Chitinophaga rhizosphaerae TaxID=1864947 RepID=UPI000F80D969|nr:hypothetical protein [Chitinophaga rhizosphaerae]